METSSEDSSEEEDDNEPEDEENELDDDRDEDEAMEVDRGQQATAEEVAEDAGESEDGGEDGDEDVAEDGDEDGAEDDRSNAGGNDIEEEDTDEPIPIDSSIKDQWDDVCRMLGLEAGVSFHLYVAADDDPPVSEVWTAERFAEEQIALRPVTEEPNVIDGEEEEDGDDVEPPRPLTMAEGLERLEGLKRYLCQQQDLPEEMMALVSRLETFLLTSQKKKQTTIDDYFKSL
ncbi:acidic leucine-rich nuclear phosphoprotein 32-related protein 1-like [Thrips palmi]|uniref:Acidic leucine-rich nuclear phosphoprotein 32-related protein 1-like n=1 Tax=Thrips palmi TaxID=161013 RepID=A0A6P8ZX45_THRPL|nr:acidic leucine-rich nuclear phosphoprotein 32-related protein 1-like [Thrips palmi]